MECDERAHPLWCEICWRITGPHIHMACSHHFCQRCVDMWLARSSTCPCCRNPMLTVMDADQLPVLSRPAEFAYVLDFSHGDHAGFSLTDVPSGIRVAGVRSGELAEGVGIRRGDILSHVNGLTCTTSMSTIEIIQYARRLRARVQVQGRHPRSLSLRIRTILAHIIKRVSLCAKLRHAVASET